MLGDVKGYVGMHGYAWELRKYDKHFSVGTKKRKILCGECAGTSPGIILCMRSSPHNFFVWGFVWGGFAWVCDTGVSQVTRFLTFVVVS